MGVPKECYGQDVLGTMVGTVEILRMFRAENGTWSSLIDVEVRATLPDGRVVEGKHKIRFGQLSQVGRRARRKENDGD